MLATGQDEIDIAKERFAEARPPMLRTKRLGRYYAPVNFTRYPETEMPATSEK